MSSILLMACAKIRNSKTQSILLLIIIMLSAVGFASSLGIITSINGPFEKTYDKLKGPDITFFMDNRIYDTANIKKWWDNKKGVEVASDLMNSAVASGAEVNGKKLDIDILMCEIPSSRNKIANLQVVEGTKKAGPDAGEIWIPTGFAYENNIGIGNIIKIPTPSGVKEFKVSAIIVDPVFSTSVMNLTRAWITPGSLTRIYPESTLNYSLLSVRLIDRNNENKFVNEFEEYLGGPFSGYIYDRKDIASTYTFNYQIIGLMLLVFAVILVLVILYIMSSIMADSVLSDYRTIGILKSTGFTPANVIFVYVLQVLLISVISIPIGIFISSFVINQLTYNLLRILNISDTNVPLLGLFAIVYVIMTTVMGLSAFKAAWKAGKVKSAEAIRYGKPPEKSNKKNSAIKLFKGLPVSISLGINQMLAHKKQMIYSFIICSVTAFVTVYSINSYESIKQMSHDRAFFGFDSSDVTVVSKGEKFGIDNNKLVAWLKSDQRVKEVLPSSNIITGVVPKDDKNLAQSIVGTCYDGDMNKLDIKNIKGENPVRDDEIAIATNTATKYGKNVGDEFSIFIEGKLLKLKVSGIYQTMSNNGQGYRITFSAIKRVNPGYELSDMLVKLKQGVDIKQFAEDVDRHFGSNVNSVLTEAKFSSKTNPATESMGVAVAFISIIFILLLVATSVSSTVLFINKNKRLYGIYKTIGLTPNQARLSIVSKNTILTLGAGIIGTLLSLYVLSPSLSLICQSMGIVQYPFTFNIGETAAVLPLMLVVSFFSSWLPSGQVLKLNSRTLLNE